MLDFLVGFIIIFVSFVIIQQFSTAPQSTIGLQIMQIVNSGFMLELCLDA